MSHTSMHDAEPSERRLTLNLTFHGVARQNEPLGESVAYRLDPVGFWDERSAGGAGEDPTPKNYRNRCPHARRAFRRRRAARRTLTPDRTCEVPANVTGWSQRVTRTSNALDLEAGVFEKDDPRAIARSLKRSAEHSTRRKSSPYRSAMSMLTFYVNRAGKTMTKKRREVLERAKTCLREEFGRE